MTEKECDQWEKASRGLVDNTFNGLLELDSEFRDVIFFSLEYITLITRD